MTPFPSGVTRSCLMSILAAALSSCVNFLNGLVENPMPVDGRLLGYWQVTGRAGRGTTLLIEPRGSSTITAIALEDAACTKVERYSATRTEIAGHDFLDTTGVDGKMVLLGPIEYEFRDSDHLSLFFPDPESFGRAVLAGELSGRVSKERAPADGQLKKKTEYTLVSIDSSTADLRRWISLHPAAMHAPFAELERRKLSLVPRCASDRK